MGLCAEVAAIGPFSADIADFLDYPSDLYAATRPGSRVVAVLFGIVEGGSAGRDLAAALGISDPWDFNQHFIDPSRIDLSQVRVVLSRLGQGDSYLRDVAPMEELAKHGFELFFLPNG